MSDFYNNAIGHWVVVAIAMTLLLFVVLTATAYTVWFERVALGRIQRRPGPNPFPAGRFERPLGIGPRNGYGGGN